MDSVGGYGGLTCFNKKYLISQQSHIKYSHSYTSSNIQYGSAEPVCGLLKVCGIVYPFLPEEHTLYRVRPSRMVIQHAAA